MGSLQIKYGDDYIYQNAVDNASVALNTAYKVMRGDIEVQVGGGLDVKENDVNFWDYDGTLIRSYTKNEFLALTGMPEAPNHKGLTFQHWNWEFQGARDYVAKYGICDIGAIYYPTDEKVHIFITGITKASPDISLYLQISGTDYCDIDWGDGNTERLYAGFEGAPIISHTYNTDNISENDIVEIKLNNAPDKYNVTLGGNSYSSGRSNNLFGVWNSNGDYLISSKLVGVFFINSFYSIKYSTYWITEIKPNYFLVLSDNVFGTGEIDPQLPSGNYTHISHFNCPLKCYLSGGTSFFHDAKTISLSQYTICSSGFSYSTLLRRIVIPEGIASRNMNALPNSYFSNCPSIQYFVIPSTINKIGANVFSNCRSAQYFDFSHHQSVPTLSNADAFLGTASNSKIYVPQSLETEWKAATNWNTYADRIVGV